MLKGSTKIELKDIKTGAVTTTEESNVVTTALNNVMKSYGIFNNSILNKNDTDSVQRPFWKTILGGILLFEEEIPYLVKEGDTSGYTETCWPPASAKMVANGSVFFSTVYKEPTEMGIFNEAESGIQADGSVKYVYDWDTSHGNGTIGCICLTSCAGGYEGYGNQSGAVQAGSSITSYNYINRQLMQPKNDIIDTRCAVIKADINKGTAYIIDGNELGTGSKAFYKTGKLHIYKCSIMTNRLKLGSDTNNIPYELYKTVNIPEESLSKYNYMYIAATDSKTGKTYISTNNSRYVIVLDSDFNLYEKDLENSYTYPISVAHDNRLYISGDISRSAMVIDVESNEIVKKFEKGEIYSFNGILCDGIIQASNDSSDRQEILLNTETFQYAVSNRKTSYKQSFFIENGLSFIRKWADENSEKNFLDLFKEGRYLATINNLSSSVTKTEEKTMKITYTIREE